MTVRVDVKPQVLRWARERARIAPEALTRRFPKYLAWESGDTHPTYRQLEKFAKTTFVPFGWLLLREPPDEPFTLPDFRTIGNTPIVSPSPNLRDTVYLCEFRQDWYREHLRVEGERPVSLVGSATTSDDAVTTAATLRRELKIDLDDRARITTWTSVLRQLIKRAEEAGLLVMLSGIVGSHTSRRLDPKEFRGFALVDEFAPLVFVNGADTKAAQLFTLVHEIAHVSLGQSALSNAGLTSMQLNKVESWCVEVAAELLVPIDVLRHEYRRHAPFVGELGRLSRRFKVSTLVTLRRLYDLGVIGLGEFQRIYREELIRIQPINDRKGGNFHATLTLRVGDRFARDLITSTLAGKTLYRDAFYLLGVKKESTFRSLASRLGVRQ